MDKFINIPFNCENLDLYIVRTNILKSIDWAIPCFKNNLLDIGCGRMPYKEYILNNSKIDSYVGLDLETADNYKKNRSPDFLWDGKSMPFKSESFEIAIATEVLEHIFDPRVLLSETYRILKPNGKFFFTIPFLWNLHDVPNDYYRYTPFAIEKLLNNIGFRNIEINATGGWHLSLAQMIGLWFRRSSINNFSKVKYSILSHFVIFIIKRLIKLGHLEEIKFKEGQMISGVYGLAEK